jgi:hypothetical protein
MVPRGLITAATVSTAATATTRQRRAVTKQGRVKAPLVKAKDVVRNKTSCLHAANVDVGVVDASQGNYKNSNNRSSRDLLVSSSKYIASYVIEMSILFQTNKSLLSRQ